MLENTLVWLEPNGTLLLVLLWKITSTAAISISLLILLKFGQNGTKMKPLGQQKSLVDFKVSKLPWSHNSSRTKQHIIFNWKSSNVGVQLSFYSNVCRLIVSVKHTSLVFPKFLVHTFSWKLGSDNLEIRCDTISQRNVLLFSHGEGHVYIENKD